MEGDNKMRKESIGKLLIAFLCAFVMVAGVFGAALTANTMDTVGPDDITAARETEREMGGTGDAPVSAYGANSAMNPTFTDAPHGTDAEIPLMENDIEMTTYLENARDTPTEINPNAATARGTRAVSVDANGPYGTQSNPLYEGGPMVNFGATVINPVPGLTYLFSWDVNNDGFSETGWQTSANYGHYFKDNFIGQSKVDAWDQTWITTITPGSGFWPDDSVNIGMYNYQGQRTFGILFTVNEDITVTELGGYRFTSWITPAIWPNYYGNLRLWTTSGVLLAGTGSVSPAADSWGWAAIPSTNLYAGNQYILSGWVRTSTSYPWYYCPGEWMPGVSADGALNPTYARYRNGNGFPNYGYTSSYIPKLDLKYEMVVTVPNVVTGYADTWVENVVPLALWPQATPTSGIEGETVDFTGHIWDPGTDDDWRYKWLFGDGSESDWSTVNKLGGSARILLLHSWQDYYKGDILDGLNDNLGSFIEVMDEYNVYVEFAAPPLSLLLDYDVVYVSWDYYLFSSALTNALGNVLADASDLGVGVVQGTFSAGPYYYSWLGGRWRSQAYNTIEYASNDYTTRSLGTVYQPGHMIMTGVSDMSGLYKHGAYALTPGATEICDYENGMRLVAVTNEDHHVPGGGRIVGLNTFPLSASGDYMKLIANSVMWGSGQAYYKSMPIETDPVSHIYADDDPTTLTPSDIITAQMVVQDDDHMTVIPLGAPVVVANEDFQGSYSWPAGWYEGGSYGWQIVNPGNGLTSYVAQVPYWYYGTHYLYSPSYDLSAATGDVLIEWDNYWWSGWGGAQQDGYVEISIDGGTSWTVLQEWHHNDPTLETATYQMYYAPAVGEPDVRLRFQCFMNNDWFWEFDNLLISYAPTYTMYGEGVSEGVDVEIFNAWPSIFVPPTTATLTNENDIITFSGLELVDNALLEPTENFFYRMIWDDGTQTPWIKKGPFGLLPVDVCNVLVVHSLEYSGNSGPYMDPVVAALYANPMVYNVDGWNIFELLASPSLALMDQYDVILHGSNWAWTGGPNAITYADAREDFGNNLADLMDAEELGVVTFCAGLDIYGSDNWAILGRYVDEPYAPFVKTPLMFATPVLGTVYEPNHRLMMNVDELQSQFISSGSMPLQPGATLVADWANGNTAVGAQKIANGMKSAHIGSFLPPVAGDWEQLLTNAIAYAYPGEMDGPEIPDTEHVYADNGIYTIDLQTIDDDMWYDTSGDQPVWAGPPGEDPEDWISHTYHRVEVYNTDPVITSPIDAYAEVDLCLRLSGNKGNSATMTLFENGGVIGETVVLREPGTPQVGMIEDAKIHVIKGYDYRVEVEYDPADDDGANPTWIMETMFPNGKIKGLKHTFNSNDGPSVWVIDSLKSFMLGTDIIFTATAEDKGSDDLAFIYNYGDSTPHGINLYGNEGGDTVKNADSDEATHIFDQLNDRDPYFIRGANDVRSPFGGPMTVDDVQTHVFDENQAYYFYVMLTVLDDDNGDGYPSPYSCDGVDMEFVECDFR